jgi:signal transduction histidine kinase
MKREAPVLVLILFVTILLIGFVKFFINKDTIHIKQTRLDFFSENLSSHKNNNLESFKNSASLMFSEMIRDSLLNQLLNSACLTDSIEYLKIKSDLSKHTLPYYNNLKTIGFSSLTFILKHADSCSIVNTGGGNCLISKTDYNQIFAKKFDEIPLSGSNNCKDKIEYIYIFPFTSGSNNRVVAYVEMGFDFQLLKKLLTNNLPHNKISFLIYISGKTDMNFEQITGSKLHENEKKLLTTLLNNASNNNANDQFSIYLNSKNHEALSFSELNSLCKHGNIFVVSLCNDQVLDKTIKLKNQLFIYSSIILLLIMLGIIFLYLNRIKLMKDKINIEQSELKLIELNHSKDKFFSILAHDLKNPFNGIMGMSGYLNERYYDVDDAERREIINDINISSKNAFNLLQNLLEWTRTQSGKIKNVPVKIDPRNIIELSLETVLILAKNKEIEIIQTLQTNRYGYADENLVSTVLRNLFTNAVKFSSRQSKVEVIVKHFENELVFCVKDFGIGLSSEEIDKLFRIDINFHKKGTEDETGTGLGLKICKEFVEYCKGRIWVVSEPMVGSSFYFTIPIYI